MCCRSRCTEYLSGTELIVPDESIGGNYVRKRGWASLALLWVGNLPIRLPSIHCDIPGVHKRIVDNSFRAIKRYNIHASFFLLFSLKVRLAVACDWPLPPPPYTSEYNLRIATERMLVLLNCSLSILYGPIKTLTYQCPKVNPTAQNAGISILISKWCLWQTSNICRAYD